MMASTRRLFWSASTSAEKMLPSRLASAQHGSIQRRTMCSTSSSGVGLEASTGVDVGEWNAEQFAAVTAPVRMGGAIRVLAGPGSGKTRVLTGRAEYLIKEMDAQPTEILCIAFTNKAAKEIGDRMDARVGKEKSHFMTKGTFHSVAVRILKKYIHNLKNCDRGRNFGILDQDDSVASMKRVMEDMKIDVKALSRLFDFDYSAGSMYSTMSKARNMVDNSYNKSGKFLVNILAEMKMMPDNPPIDFAEVFDRYEAAKRAMNVMDFDDLLIVTVGLFDQCPQVLWDFGEQSKYILVDEFQDTNSTQYRLISQLMSEKASSLFVVGDGDQSIYAFRGANMANLVNRMRVDFPNLETYELIKNYRSTEDILRVASHVLESCHTRSPLRLTSSLGAGNPVQLMTLYDSKIQASKIVDEACRLNDDGTPLNEMAVLYRQKSSARELEEAFIYANVPYTLIGGTPFYGRKEIKDLVAYLKVIANVSDTRSLYRIINVPPRGLGQKSLDKLDAWADTVGRPLGCALLDSEEFSSVQSSAVKGGLGSLLMEDILPAKELGMSSKLIENVKKFCTTISHLRQMASNEKLVVFIERLIEETGYRDHLELALKKAEKKYGKIDPHAPLVRKGSDEAIKCAERVSNVHEFVEMVREQPDKSLTDFLEEIALYTDAKAKEEEDKDSVKLMTMHVSKGLEFETVFLPNFQQYPFVRCEYMTDLELMKKEWDEECRLIYVALTRAKRNLKILCTAGNYSSRTGQHIATRPGKFMKRLTESASVDQLGCWENAFLNHDVDPHLKVLAGFVSKSQKGSEC